MKASDALKISKIAQEMELTPYRRKMLENIKSAAMNGYTYLMPDAGFTYGDMLWLRKLGYIVEPPVIQKFVSRSLYDALLVSGRAHQVDDFEVSYIVERSDTSPYSRPGSYTNEMKVGGKISWDK